MKTKIAFAAIALALSSSAAFASLEDLNTNTVTFNGEVKSASCNVNVPGQGQNAVINLPIIDKSDLQNDTLVAATPFTLEVTNCDFHLRDGENKFTLTWNSATLADGTTQAKGLLKNEAEQNPAEGVYLSLVDGENQQVIIPGGSNSAQQQIATENGATFSYKVGYNTEDRTKATAGHLSSKATYTLSYE